MPPPIPALLLNALVAKVPGNLGAGSGGVSVSFTTPTGQTVTVLNGVITNVFGGGVGPISPTNSEWFANLNARFGVVATCAELQDQVDDVFEQLQNYFTAINQQTALLAPILALLTAPTNPTAVITWITNFIDNFLTPYVVPYTTMAAQLTQLSSEVASMTSAIEDAASRIGAGCSITIPPIV